MSGQVGDFSLLADLGKGFRWLLSADKFMHAVASEKLKEYSQNF